MNCFDFSQIQEIVKNLEILFYFLKFVKETSMKEYKLYLQLKNGNDQSSSSDNSFSIDVFEKNIFNNIKQSLNLRIHKRNNSVDRIKLNGKNLSLSFYKKDEEKEFNYFNHILGLNSKKIQKQSKSEDNLIYNSL